jgi:cytosine/adenosine deaminase-related metal-dependent hydrolase
MTVNAHTHLYSGLAPFMPRFEATQRSFLEILQTFWWRLDRALDETSLRAAARFYVAEARRLGTTVLIDHHESPNMIEGSLDILADVCEELGMRALLCYGATERNGGRDEARRGLAECRRFIETNRRPLIRGAVGLHAAFTVSDETMEEAGQLCRELDVPLHVHVAEDPIDSDGFARLVANQAIVPGSILAHAVHLRHDEVQLANQLGCWFVHNPRSNRANGVGYAYTLRAASRVALGTDGFPSDIAAEAAALHSPEDTITRRVAAGEKLATKIFGDLTPIAYPKFDLDTIRADALREAIGLAERMQGVTDGNFTVEEQCR